MAVVVWFIGVYLVVCAAVCWCCCKLAGDADARAHRMRCYRKALVHSVLCKDHQWFFRTDASKLQMHLLRQAYRKDAWIERTRIASQRELLCVYVPDFYRRGTNQRKSFRV